MSPCGNLRQKFDITDRLNQEVEENLVIKHKFQIDLKRNGFARDRDRILFTNAFLRLQHKTQVFSNEMGDHFKTRLTHSLEVSQIARSLARYLSVDEDLVEAMALGHDIGHTPFGHEGERILDDIMSGKDKLGMDKIISLNHGGFKHNYNSLRVLDVTQPKFIQISGLNLSWQVLEGILKHTKIHRHKRDLCNECGDCWDINRFVSEKNLIDRMYLKYDFSVTIEGQIVAIADEIAQRQHDIDDGLRGLPSIKLDNLFKGIINKSDEIISEFENSVKENIYLKNERDHLRNCCDLLNKFVEKLNENNKLESNFHKTESLVRNIIEYFILDVFATTIYKYKSDNQHSNILQNVSPRKNILLEKRIVTFSKIAYEMNKFIENYVNKEIINSFDINKYDGKSRYIIRQLFKAYYNNPLQMPYYALKRLEIQISQNSKIYSIELKSKSPLNNKKLEEVRFKDGDRNEINSLLSTLKLKELNDNIVNYDKILNHITGDSKTKSKPDLDKLIINSYKKIEGTSLEKLTSEDDKFLKCLLENNHAYFSTICDYISGMSDNYAKKEFTDLY
ncbi:MAG TPA: dNTP triphosphohydrolase [archaeon]|nr:dNTP triphosphohydrolase [archaeon]